jgi:hypothetical protein
MVHKFPPVYALASQPSPVHAGRHRWVITGNGMPIRTSARSFETPKKAHADGLIELGKLVKTSRTAWVRPNFRAPVR